MWCTLVQMRVVVAVTSGVTMENIVSVRISYVTWVKFRIVVMALTKLAVHLL